MSAAPGSSSFVFYAVYCGHATLAELFLAAERGHAALAESLRS